MSCTSSAQKTGSLVCSDMISIVVAIAISFLMNYEKFLRFILCSVALTLFARLWEMFRERECQVTSNYLSCQLKCVHSTKKTFLSSLIKKCA